MDSAKPAASSGIGRACTLRVSSRPQLMVRVMAEYLTMSGAQATDKYPTGRNEVGSVEHVYEEARHDWSTVS